MIVGQHHGGGVVAEGMLRDTADGNIGAIHSPISQIHAVDHAEAVVQQKQIHPLYCCTHIAAMEKFSQLGYRIEGRSVVYLAGLIAAENLGEHFEEQGSFGAYPFDGFKLLSVGVQHGGKGAEAIDQGVGLGIYITAEDGVGQEQLHDLMVGKIIQTGALVTLPKTVAVTLVNVFLFTC
jgi:hypothetical protein